MPLAPNIKPGTFCWVDLMTTDQEAAKRFYGTLFGWTAEDMPAGEGIVYSMMKLKGENAGAIAPLPPDLAQQGVPPHWNSYVLVEDVDTATAKAKDLGAAVQMEPFDVFEAGRMSVLADPTGAVFMLWQASEHGGATIVNEPGAFGWNELATRDVAAAKDFYPALFGWTADTDTIDGTEYTTFRDGQIPRGGLIEMTDQWPPGVPPHWLVYFGTADADAGAAQVKELGGSVLVEPQDVGDIGRFAVFGDPQGAVFAVIRMNEPPPEPR